MPLKSQGGGPWGGGGPSGPTPPDIEEMLRRGQDRFKRFLPSGGGSVRVIVLIVLVVVALWAGSGFYRVQPGEQGVELLFGKFIKLTSPCHVYHPGTTVDWLGALVLRAANLGASADAVTAAVLADPETHLRLIGTVFIIIGISAANV